MIYVSFKSKDNTTFVPFAFWIVKIGIMDLSYKRIDNDNVDLYFSGVGLWGECSFIRMTGDFLSAEPVNAVPEDAVPITISD